MTQQEYENKIKELEKQIAELKMAKIEEPQSKRWKPKHRDAYYIFESTGRVDCDTWDNDPADDWRYLIGNCFKTKKEAEEYKKQIEYTARYKNYIEEHSEPIDWNDGDQLKYYARFNYLNTVLEFDYVYIVRFQGTIYASSKEIIRDAIKEIGKNNFKKYVLGVK